MAADYKTKYLDIRAKLVESTDVAYRLGFEEGMKEGERAAEQAAQEQQMMMEQQAMAQGGSPEEQAAMMGDEAEVGMEGEEGEEMESAAMMGEEMPEDGGSDLDSHISELENMVAKGEKPKVTDIRKAVLSLVDVRKSFKTKTKKKQKKVVAAQKQFVDSILKGWEAESKDVDENLEDAIKESGFKIE